MCYVKYTWDIKNDFYENSMSCFSLIITFTSIK
jgi:hypothetical protein